MVINWLAGCHMGGGMSKKRHYQFLRSRFCGPEPALSLHRDPSKRLENKKSQSAATAEILHRRQICVIPTCHPNFHETFVLYSALKSNVHNYSRKFSENPCALICQKKHIENMQMLFSVTLCCQVTMIVMI